MNFALTDHENFSWWAKCYTWPVFIYCFLEIYKSTFDNCLSRLGNATFSSSLRGKSKRRNVGTCESSRDDSVKFKRGKMSKFSSGIWKPAKPNPNPPMPFFPRRTPRSSSFPLFVPTWKRAFLDQILSLLLVRSSSPTPNGDLCNAGHSSPSISPSLSLSLPLPRAQHLYLSNQLSPSLVLNLLLSI